MVGAVASANVGAVPARAVLVVLVALALCATGCQERLIHHQRRYTPEAVETPEQWLPAGSVAVRYATDQGAQVAFYVPPRGAPADAAPERLWMAFGGNGGVALDLAEFVTTYPGTAGFLLFDYPGHGANAGTPGPATIRAAALAAQTALATRLGVSTETLARRTAVLGISLGCATGLQFAAAQPVRGAVLVAPFTTMFAEVRHVTCWCLAIFLTHRYDNLSTLAVLRAHAPPPPVSIIHGEADRLIPPYMGRDLAAANPGVRLISVLAGHNDVIGIGRSAIVTEMQAIDVAP